MKNQRIPRVSGRAVLVLSFLALITVLIGYLQDPHPDEGASAHIFQLTIVLLVPALLLFLVSADWSEGRRALRTLIPAGFALALALAALYYLEHVWYVHGPLHTPR